MKTIETKAIVTRDLIANVPPTSRIKRVQSNH